MGLTNRGSERQDAFGMGGEFIYSGRQRRKQAHLSGGTSESILDITFVTEKLAVIVRDCKVLDEETLSLHNYISFNVVTSNRPCKSTIQKKGIFSRIRFQNSVRRNFNSDILRTSNLS